MKLPIICATLFIFLIACSAGESSSQLTDNDWQVDRIIVGDSVILLDSEEHPSLSFAADSVFGGQTMCNSISGTYHTTPAGGISMSIEAITTAFCPENTIEGILIEQISLTHHYSMAGDTLLLKDADGRTVIKLSPTTKKYNER